MQCVILAGGLGTRMRPLTDRCPKTLLPVRGRPFAWHQLEWLAAQGVTEVVYCIGHHGGMIRNYWRRERPPLPRIRYVDEGGVLLGTAGALRLAHAQQALNERFFVIYGDSFLPVEFEPVWRGFESCRQPALMTVLRNAGRWDRSNVFFDRGRLLLYDKTGLPGMQHIDYGLSCFERELFAHPGPSDLAVLFHELSLDGRLAGFEVHERFYEIGSPAGLRDFEQYLDTREAAPFRR